MSVDPKPFRLNARNLAFLFALGTVKGDKITFSVADLEALETTRSRTSESDLGAQIDALVGPRLSELTDGVGTLTFRSREIKAAGFADSALKNVNYWRSPVSAAARAAIERGWVVALVTKYNEDADAMVVTVTFSRGPAVADTLAKLEAAVAKHLADKSAEDSAADEVSEAPAEE